jgi:transposase InsO family protein
MMAQMLAEEYAYPIRETCKLVGLSVSTYYYTSQAVDNSQLQGDLEVVLGEFPRYGTRRATHQLRRPPYSYQVNRKRVQRLMRQKGWLQPVKRYKYRTTNSDHPYPRYANLVKDLWITRPDQVWVADITYIRLREGFVFLAVVMDVCTRAIRGWCLSRSLDVTLSQRALEMGLAEHVPEIHHSDQGVQYAASDYVKLLKTYQVQISMAAVGEPEENGYAERLMRTIKEEEVDLSDYRDFSDAQSQIGRFLMDVYNHKRIHSSLGYLTPVEFEFAYRLTLTQPVGSTP